MSTDENPPSQDVEERSVDADEMSLEEIISRLPEGTSVEVIEMIRENLYFSGPLPPPAIFERYDRILPGAADRILKLAENEQSIRRGANRGLIINDGARIWGSIFVSLALIASAVYCAFIGQPELAGVLGTTGAVGGIVRAFLNRR